MDEQRLERARRRIRRLRDFYMHVAIYVVVLAGIAIFNWMLTPDFWWVVFPAVGWGIGLAAHAVSVLFEDSLFNADWEERKTR